jgi:hypothetical protein
MDRPGPGGSDDPRFRKLEMLRGYLDAVGGYARLAHDPHTAGIAAVVTASDILRPRGTDAAIEYFTKILPETRSPAIQRAIRIQLMDLYKMYAEQYKAKGDDGRAQLQQDKALEQVRILITTDPSKEPATASPPPPDGNPPPPR